MSQAAILASALVPALLLWLAPGEHPSRKEK